MPLSNQKGGISWALFLVIILVGVGGGLYMLFKDTSPPAVTMTPAGGPVSPKTQITLAVDDAGSGVAAVTLVAVKGDERDVLFQQNYAGAPRQVSETVSLESLRFGEGEFMLQAEASDASFAGFGKGNSIAMPGAYSLDTRPPRISVQSLAHNLQQGGAGAIAYTLSEPAVRTGVRVGDYFFDGYQQENGHYVCIFAFPFFMTPDEFAPMLTAVDAAGNERVQQFSYTARPRDFKVDVIALPDSFLERKMPEFEIDVPGQMTHLERFLRVNRDIRKQNRAALQSIGQDTAPTPLWTSNSFTRMAGKPMAGFGEFRSYKYEGETVDQQTHLGVDLAALRNFPVPASNSGKVVFADTMGIYGQCVILDHGLGLMTLYAHLSSIDVNKGDMVEIDQVIGKTGMSGMAGGDHLHFAVLVGGLPVYPIEWWDGHWVKVNVADRL